MTENHDSLLSTKSPPLNLDALIPLPQVGREMVVAGYSDRPVPYGPVWRAVVSGEIPAEPIIGNRMGVRRRNLPLVASVLRLTAAGQSSGPPAREPQLATA